MFRLLLFKITAPLRLVPASDVISSALAGLANEMFASAIASDMHKTKTNETKNAIFFFISHCPQL